MLNFLTDPVDLYCERLGPGLTGEPFNLLSNLAFIVAAWLLRTELRHETGPAGDRLTVSTRKALAWYPPGVAMIGLGSGLFHAFANVWSKFADVIPITLLIAWVLYYWHRRILGSGPGELLVRVGALAALTGTGIAWGLSQSWIGGSQNYLGVAAYLWYMAFEYRGRPGSAALWLTAPGFLLALVFRSADHQLCGTIPVGSHFLWHLTMSGVCYGMGHALIRATGGVAQPSATEGRP